MCEKKGKLPDRVKEMDWTIKDYDKLPEEP